MAPTEMFASTENIGVDKLFASTKCWRRQHVAVDKMLAATKYLRRQNTCVDKILASTEISCRRKPRVNKNLGRTKCWRMRGSISLLFGSAESTAADFSQTSLMFSCVSQMVLIHPHAVAKCSVASGHPAFMGGLSPAVYRLVPACHAENVANVGVNKILAPAKISLIFAKLNIFARRRPIKNW